MRIWFIGLFLSLAGCVSTTKLDSVTKLIPTANDAAPETLYINGLWYVDDGKKVRFIKGSRYQEDGIFKELPRENEGRNFEVIDLKGRYIIPPFGEAHNHSVDGPWTVKTAQRYLDQGIFYYKNPNNLASVAIPERERWQQADSLDVIFSHGGLSIDEGHPEQLYKNLAPMFGLDPDSLDGTAFFNVETSEKLQSHWPKILADRPDFLKLYLLNHDGAGGKASEGLSEDIFRAATAKARKADLQTTVHVETAADLRLAVDSGANEAGHLPGYMFTFGLTPDHFRISPELADQMARQGFVTVTTTVISESRHKGKPEMLARVRGLQKENLQTLKDANAILAIGSDSFGQTARDEVSSLRNLQVFSDEELLRIWIDTPSVSIFPKRAIGVLAKGYEASFIALACNPITNLDCVDSIEIAVKQGQILK